MGSLIASMLRTLELPEERFVAILKNCDAVFKDLVRGKSIPMETLTLLVLSHQRMRSCRFG